jgi:hypothetical protein
MTDKGQGTRDKLSFEFKKNTASSNPLGVFFIKNQNLILNFKKGATLWPNPF